MASVKMTRDKLAAKKTCGPVLKTSRPFMIMETEQQLEHDEQLCFEEFEILIKLTTTSFLKN